MDNQNQAVQKSLSLLNKVGKKLLSIHDWQIVTKEQTFTLTGAGSYTRDTIFSDGDFLRYVENTDWDRTNQRKMQLITDAEWQVVQSGIVSLAGINKYYRERGGNILIDPDTSGEEIVFEYISKNWITDSTGTTNKSSFTSDDDEVRFPEFLVELGLKYELKAGEGLPALFEKDEFQTELRRNIASETARRDLGNSRLKFNNIPDIGYGQ